MAELLILVLALHAFIGLLIWRRIYEVLARTLGTLDKAREACARHILVGQALERLIVALGDVALEQEQVRELKKILSAEIEDRKTNGGEKIA